VCASVDPGVLLALVVVSLALAAVTLRTRVVVDQRGITLTESLIAVVIALLLVAILFAVLERCGTTQVGVAGSPARPLPAGAVLTGLHPPPTAPRPSCQGGDVCRTPGARCEILTRHCTDTYSYEPIAKRWECACECR
jgi:hypothetical protein